MLLPCAYFVPLTKRDLQHYKSLVVLSREDFLSLSMRTSLDEIKIEFLPTNSMLGVLE